MLTLNCPICTQALRCDSSHRSWRCANGHTFDVAKQGYVNLLPVQNKRSKDPGDSKAMVLARAEFLRAKYYQPLADKIAQLVLNGKPQTLLDAGCGGGYYLRELLAQAEQRQQSLNCVGLDISKWAVQFAAKQSGSTQAPRVTWLVASNSQIPLPADSVDTLLCLFGFPVSTEFNRVLKPSGRLIMVDPASEHLLELKQIIYPQVHSKPEQLPVPADTWQLADEQRLTFVFELNQREHIQHLLAMTPHLYRASSQGRAKAAALEQITLTADMWVRTFVSAV
ncbi:putative RNA methyltransferase [Pseudidiomarina sp. WS423]|uniref:putative RNA methyltransferase n=1 Tax=Pseudidiomarina sp. WS423 TaxID=3425124 RepID=UPI003D6EB4D8